jgi:hypothetical protein
MASHSSTFYVTFKAIGMVYEEVVPSPCRIWPFFEGCFKVRFPGWWGEEGERRRRKVRTVQKTTSEQLLPPRVVLLD